LLNEQAAKGAPAGLMSSHVGPRYSVEELREKEGYCEGDDVYLARVRAYPVLALIGKQLLIQRDTELPSAVARLLTEFMPDWKWDESQVTLGPFRKYFLMHAIFPAPKDESTGQPMALEIYGDLISMDGMALNSEAGRAWRTQQIMHRMENYLDTEVTGSMVIEIHAASYANIMFPGVCVSFYM